MTDYSEVVVDNSDGSRCESEYAEAMHDATTYLLPKENVPVAPYIADDSEFDSEIVDAYMDDLNMLIDAKYEGERLSFGFHPDLPGCLMLAGDEWWNPEDNEPDFLSSGLRQVPIDDEEVKMHTMTELW